MKSYAALIDGSENDVRFVYCAAAISYILQDWRGMDKEAVLKYIRESIVSRKRTFERTHFTNCACHVRLFNLRLFKSVCSRMIMVLDKASLQSHMVIFTDLIHRY